MPGGQPVPGAVTGARFAGRVRRGADEQDRDGDGGPGRDGKGPAMTEFVCRRTGQAYEVGEQLDQDGHAVVHAVVSGGPDLALKQYLPATLQRRPDLEARIKAMIANPPAYRPDPSGPVICAWPEDAAYISGQFAGFVMPRVDTREAVTIPDLAARRATTWRERVAVAENLTRAVAVLHDRDVVIGDFRKWNLLTWSDSRVTLLGCDRMQVVDPESGRRFPSVAGRDACTPPELQLPATLSSTIRTSSSDIFGLALHLHLLLLQGAHPFRGQWRGGGDSPPEHLLAQEGLWAYAGDRRLDPCPGSAPLTVLPATLQQYFRAAFVDGARNPDTRPPAQDWLNELLRLRESLVTCAVEPTHSYGRHLSSCPWCPGSPSRAGSTPPGYIPRQASTAPPAAAVAVPVERCGAAPGTPRPCRRGNPPRTTGAAEPGHAIRHPTSGVHTCSPTPQRAPPGSVGGHRRGRHRRRRRGEHGVAPSRTPRTRPHGFGTSAHQLDTAAAAPTCRPDGSTRADTRPGRPGRGGPGRFVGATAVHPTGRNAVGRSHGHRRGHPRRPRRTAEPTPRCSTAQIHRLELRRPVLDHRDERAVPHRGRSQHLVRHQPVRAAGLLREDTETIGRAGDEDACHEILPRRGLGDCVWSASWTVAVNSPLWRSMASTLRANQPGLGRTASAAESFRSTSRRSDDKFTARAGRVRALAVIAVGLRA